MRLDASARVARVVAAGRRVADPADPLGRAARALLATTSGLSPEGIALALTEHLETPPTEAELGALIASTGRAPRCHVILSANVCTAALRAIALAAATSPEIHVRPSRRDPVMAELLVEALHADDAFTAQGGSILCTPNIAPAPRDELHVYGSDASIEAILATIPPGVVVRAHGTGLGIAVVGASVDLVHAASGIARDVVPFDQRGCLSPRVVLVEGGADRAEALGAALDEALRHLGERVPRGSLDEAMRRDVAMYRATIEALGTLHEGPMHVVGVDPSPRALPLPPAARVVHVAAADPADAARLLGPWADFVTTVGASEDSPLVRAVLACVPFARRAELGWMQRPPLDGPVDRRVRALPGRTASAVRADHS
jgi:hypothetical protein